MTAKKLTLKNYRNIEMLEIFPDDKINIFYGNNAQGKTNIIEALWMFTGAKSFKAGSDSEVIAIGTKECSAVLDFFAQGRAQTSKIIFKEKNEVFLNECPEKSRNALSGKFCAMIFAPEHKGLVKDGPSVRRKFINTAMCQIRPKYARLLAEYEKSVTQRNALLKDIPYHSELMDTLDFWDIKLSETGGKIAFLRQSYVDKIREYSSEIYQNISEQTENLDIEYKTAGKGETAKDFEQNILNALKEGRKDDIITGITKAGVHRDDLEITVNGLSTRVYASQGQMRSGALALKLSEAAVLEQYIGESPICLLDDVMSELDTGRQNYILNHIKNFQVFITCCDPSQVLGRTDGKLFETEKGKVEVV